MSKNTTKKNEKKVENNFNQKIDNLKKSKIVNFIKTYQKTILIGITFLIIIGLSIFLFIDYNSKINKGEKPLINKIISKIIDNNPFQVQGGNFDFGQKKIPFNIKNIDISFNQKIDPNTINKDTFSIFPFVDGEIKLVNENTISYVLKDNLKNDSNYEIYISKNIKNKKGENLMQDLSYYVTTTDPAKVTKVIPEGKLENLNQNIVIIFNLPMISLSDLNSKDKNPCPIEISPKIEGKCKWTTSNILEFIPNNGFNGASDYQIQINNDDKFIYPLTEKFNSTIQTPDLKIFTNNNFTNNNEKEIDQKELENKEYFDPNEGIKLKFNFPVSKQEIETKIKLYDEQGKILETIIKSDNNSESSYNLTLKDLNFEYSTKYKIELIKGINPKYGNRKLDEEFSKEIYSNSFANSINIFQSVFSTTGQIIDTIDIFYDGENNSNTNYYVNSYNFLPNNNLFFQLELGQEVTLNKEFFEFISNDKKTIPFEIEYIKEEKELKGEKIVNENKKRIKLTLKDNLENEKEYSLIIKKEINNNLNKNIVYTYKTSPKLEILEHIFLGYSKSCFYTNNPIKWNNDNKNSFGTTPISRVAGFEDFIPWNIMEEAEKYHGDNIEQKNKFYIQNGYCPIDYKGLYSNTINTRLNPYSEYNLIFSGSLTDIYGNQLGKEYNTKVTTKGIQQEDIYSYTSTSKYVNVVPDTVPLILNIQSMNTNKIKIEACQTGVEGYIKFLETNIDLFFDKYCKNKIKKTLDVENKNWFLSNSKFDLETEIFGQKFKEKYIFIRGTGTEFEQEYGKSFFNVYIRNNMTIAYEDGENKKLILATDLYGQEIIKDLKFNFYSSSFNNNTYLYEYKTIPNVKYTYNNEKNVYEIENIENVSLIEAYKNGFYASVNINVDGLSNYELNNATSGSYEKDFVFLYTDRPLYKPGETVYFKGLIRSFSINGYRPTKETKGALIIMDESRNEINQIPVDIDSNSNFNGQFSLPDDIGLGAYKIHFQADSNKYTYPSSYTYYVEEFVNPTFKVDIQAEEKSILLGDTASFTIKPEYYFGGKLINTTGEYKILKQNYYFDAKYYSDYQFGEGYGYFACIYWGECTYNDYLQDNGEFQINENGEYKFEYKYPQDNGEQIYSFIFTVKDPSTKKTVSKTISQILHNTDGYVGLKNPYWNDKNQGINMKGIILDLDSNPTANKKVNIQVIKREWKTVKKQGIDGVFYNDYSLIETIEDKFELTSNNNGEFEKNIKTKDSGEYGIKAIYTGNNNKSFVSNDIVYVSGDGFIEWQIANNDITELIGDKVIMNIGETQEYLLKSPVNNGKALIVIEKDDGILDYFIHEIKSQGDKISIEVKENYYPNFYIKAFLVGKENENPLPVYKRALAVTKVNTEYKELAVEIITDKKYYLPSEQVDIKIKVKDKNGLPVKGANGHISIVDQSLLALKGNPKKNPYAFFYDMKRYLGVTTYSNLKSLIEKLEVKDSSDGKKGGDGENIKGGDSSKKRGVFKNTAFWMSDFITDENGEYSIKTEKLPDNLTTWEIESLINTTGDTKIGIAYHEIITNKKLMISENLPRFVSSQDKIFFSPTIFNKTGNNGKFKISMNATNIDISNNEQIIQINDGEQKIVYFEGKIKDIGIINNNTNPTSLINITAKEIDSNNIDEIEKIIQIKENSTQEQVSTFDKTDSVSFEQQINLENIIKNKGNLKINYSATLLTSILDGIQHLNTFPYGCLEQRLSGIIPNILIKKLYEAVGIKYDLKEKYVEKRNGTDIGYEKISVDQIINDTLAVINKFQNLDGGFSYWQDLQNKTSDFWLSAYTLESVAQIKEIGYVVDEKIFEKTIEYIKNTFYENNKINCENNLECGITDQIKLFAINAILTYNPADYEAYKMWKLISKNDSNSLIIENTKIISKLLKLKDVTQEEKDMLKKDAIEKMNIILKEELIINPRGAYLGKDNYLNRISNTANFLYLISELGLENFEDVEKISENIIRWLISQKSNGTFGSTQDTLIVIKAIIKYLESSKELEKINMEIKLNLNGKNIEKNVINNDNKLDVFSINLPTNNLENNNAFNIEKVGNGTVYFDLSLNYYLPTTNINSRDEGFNINVKYFDYNEYQKIKSKKEIEWNEYLNGKLSYDELEYPKEIFDYLEQKNEGKVGDLLVGVAQISTPELRNKVAFESYIPAGSELINPNLDTDSGISIGNNKYFDYETLFEKKEYRNDRLFGYSQTMNPGIHKFVYIIRLTHGGDYNIKPSKIYEFYNQEVFGRNEGKIFTIKK